MKDTEVFEKLDEKCQGDVREVYKFARDNGYYGRGFKKYMTGEMLSYSQENSNAIINLKENDFKMIKENCYKNNIRKIFNYMLCSYIYVILLSFFAGDFIEKQNIYKYFLDNIIFFTCEYILIIYSIVKNVEAKKEKEHKEKEYKGKKLDMFLIGIVTVVMFASIFVNKLNVEICSIRKCIIECVNIVAVTICAITYILSIFNHEIMSFMKK